MRGANGTPRDDRSVPGFASRVRRELWFPVDVTPAGFPIGRRAEPVDSEGHSLDLEDDASGAIEAQTRQAALAFGRA